MSAIFLKRMNNDIEENYEKKNKINDEIWRH